MATLSGCVGTDLIDDLATNRLTVAINPPDDPSLEVGDSLQLTVQLLPPGTNPEDVFLTWSSSRPEVVTVDDTGLVRARAEGTAEVTVAANGTASDPYPLVVGAAVVPPEATGARTGALMGSGGYQASGTVTLQRGDDGILRLMTSDDFTVSVALGTYLYLSNSQEGGATASGGLEIADVSESATGAQVFNVTEIDGSVMLDTYQYVVVLCKPAQLTFGSAKLN